MRTSELEEYLSLETVEKIENDEIEGKTKRMKEGECENCGNTIYNSPKDGFERTKLCNGCFGTKRPVFNMMYPDD